MGHTDRVPILPVDLVPAGFDQPGFTLYRLWAGPNLAYVGQTQPPLLARLGYHSAKQSWWPLVSRCTAEQRASYGDLLDAELTAIRTEWPWFNRQWSPGPRPSVLHGPRGRDGLTPEERVFFHSGLLV